MDLSASIVDFYSRYDEAGRLDRRPSTRLERIRTLELLEHYLPTPAAVLDVGGGPGAYAAPLLAAGHRVRLVDLVPAHVAQARAAVPGLDAVVGDARDLPSGDGEWDATLLFGPLYHLLDRSDRVRALREAVRVTRPGGLVLAAAISRFAASFDFVVRDRLTERTLADSRRLLTDGANDPGTGFTHAWFHRVPELVAECAEAGLTPVEVHGVEGPLWTAVETSGDDPGVFDGALEMARLYSTEPALLAASAHLLVAGRRPPVRG
ncbi:class I SAM-dependent methyltransferase [Actinoplanes sp. G11-F43]|uniref:class I SAM-dependent methyltransferase n=1 Tax=Actinoplanes sp. G11-F43 TaxID=3424130 RepID=UPI003D34FC89